MIDFIKFIILCSSDWEEIVNRLLENPLLFFREVYDRRTSELRFPAVATFGYDKFLIRILKDRIEIRGSLHILFNVLIGKGETNHDDFDIIKLTAVIRYLEDKLNLDMSQTIMQNLENVVNLRADYKVKKVLANNLIVWNGRRPSVDRDLFDKGWLVEFNIGGEKPEKYLKFYDKGRHKAEFMEAFEEIIRFEIKVMRSRLIQESGIYNVCDLLDKNNLQKLGDNLLKYFEQMVIVDSINEPVEMTNREKKIFNWGMNRLNWEDVTLNKVTKSRRKTTFLNVIKKYGLTTLKDTMTEGIKTKWQELQNRDENITFDFLGNIRPELKNVNQTHTFNFLVKGENGKILCHDLVKIRNNKRGGFDMEIESFKKSKMLTKPILVIGGFGYHLPTQCPVTKIDISNQRKGSKCLSQKTILEMLESGDSRVTELKKKYLAISSEKLSNEKIAKRISWRIQHLAKKGIKSTLQADKNFVKTDDGDDDNLSE